MYRKRKKVKKKWDIIIGLVLIITLLSTSIILLVFQRETGWEWRGYENKKFGFKLKYPVDWEVFTSEDYTEELEKDLKKACKGDPNVWRNVKEDLDEMLSGHRGVAFSPFIDRSSINLKIKEPPRWGWSATGPFLEEGFVIDVVGFADGKGTELGGGELPAPQAGLMGMLTGAETPPFLETLLERKTRYLGQFEKEGIYPEVFDSSFKWENITLRGFHADQIEIIYRIETEEFGEESLKLVLIEIEKEDLLYFIGFWAPISKSGKWNENFEKMLESFKFT
jgi:hypothetical protein